MSTTLDEIADQPLEPCCSGCGLALGPEGVGWDPHEPRTAPDPEPRVLH